MPTATVRYGRPKGTGLDDRQQLETIAALLAANPKLKPTTAIRSLGVEDPSAIRRLREKLRVELASPAADARPAVASHCLDTLPPTSNENTPVPDDALPSSAARVPAGTDAVRPMPPSVAMLAGWCDLAFSMLSTAATVQAELTHYWLGVPPVAAAVRGQVALGTMAVAFCARRKGPRRTLH